MTRKNIPLLFSLILILLCSWKEKGSAPMNQNTWRVKIGNTILLSSQKDQMGDTVQVYLNELNPSDTLFAEQNLCGQSANGEYVSLVLADEKDRVRLNSTNKESRWAFTGYLPVNMMLHSRVAPGDALKLYFSITGGRHEGRNELLCVLKFN